MNGCTTVANDAATIPIGPTATYMHQRAVRFAVRAAEKSGVESIAQDRLLDEIEREDKEAAQPLPERWDGLS